MRAYLVWTFAVVHIYSSPLLREGSVQTGISLSSRVSRKEGNDRKGHAACYRGAEPAAVRWMERWREHAGGGRENRGENRREAENRRAFYG
jgi:hypothetical protein